MEREISALKLNNTWNLVRKPNNVEVVDCRWVYRLKKEPGGTSKYKARLVARGFSQVYGENFWDTYAPVVKSSTVRLLMACAVERDMHVEQIDVRNAYVQSELKEIIYMRQPPGFQEDDDMVCRLNKSLYGLKQAGFEWNKCLNTFLVNDMKFKRLKSDPCVYIKSRGDNTLIISIYVDDILIFSKQKPIISEFKAEFNRRFEIEDLEECRKIIGIEVNQKESTIELHQRSFIEEVLTECGMEACHPKRTPSNNALELICDKLNCDACELVDQTKYRSTLGKLLYIAGSTRPDIKYVVSSLSRFSGRPHLVHWSAMRHVISYLKGTIHYRIRYRKTGNNLVAYSDADYANCKLDRRSYTGYVLVLGGGPISWESKKQPTVALSSTEAEYMAVTSAAKEIMFCRSIAFELGFGEMMRGPTTLCVDNKGAIELAQKTGYSARTKHIDVRHHYIRETVDNGYLELKHVPTEEQLADMLTKGLGSTLHERNVKSLLAVD